MDVIESVIRSLIREGKISRARALLSIFADEYPHLLLEVEAAAGNYRIVKKIYPTLSKELQKRYEELYKKALEKAKEDYSGDFKEAVSELGKNNLEGALALIEGITRKHPELLEAIALKYEIAKKKGETTKAKRIEEIIKGIDPSHPVLAVYGVRREKKVSSQPITNALMLVSIMIVLALSIISLLVTPNLSHIKKIENKVESLEKTIEKAMPDIKNRKYLTAEDVRNIVKEELKSIAKAEDIESIKSDIESIASEVANLYSAFDTFKGDMSKVSRDISYIKDRIEKISFPATVVVAGSPTYSRVALASGGEDIFENWEKIYKPSSELDRAKIYWLAGYAMYLKGKYRTAVRLFEKCLDIVEAKFPRVYFHDDCFYYRALSYYMMGDYWQAHKLFNEFIIEFPRSQYADDARYFLKKISGGI